MKNNTKLLSLANFVGRVVGFLNILVIRLPKPHPCRSLSFDRMRNCRMHNCRMRN
ncbi:MAG: hypothetical protein ACLPP9_07225 [Smithella sp.]